MALRGNLRDFSLPDVFQLVTFSKKTGVLRIKRADGTVGSVWFRDGDVFFAQSNWHGEPLGERLVAASRITPSALAKALDIRAAEGDGGRRLGEVLVEEGYITDKVLEAFVQEQIQDTIFDLMRWDEGEFDFELLPDVVDEDIGLSVSIENVIMEGSRRLEEWTRIKKKIPSMDIVFKMATAPGEGTFEISLKPIEWNLLLLVDGTRSVSELAADTNRTDFEVARIMYGLFSAGLLEVATDEEVERLRAERAEREVHTADLRAQRVEVEAEETREALAREEALEAEAEERRAGTKAAESATVAEPAPGRPEPEMPEFLAGEAAQPASPQDMAVFEEMMGVLEVPARESVEPETEPEQAGPAVEPELPPELELRPESDFGPELDMQDEALLGVLDVGLGADIPVAPAFEEAPESPAPTGDLERDLMALGLGELPSGDLLAPMGEPEAEPGGEPEFEIAAILDTEAVAELEPLAAEEVAFGGDLESFADLQGLQESVAEPVNDIELGADLTLAEIEAAALAAQSDAASEFEIATSADLELETGPELELDAEAAMPDLTDILESLDEAAPEIVQTESLEEESELGVAPSMGVISTDAFLADIAPEELGIGMSGGLSDELSALTGAGGSRRPTANVKKLPEPGTSLDIHLDQAVDKELVLKVIEGIKNL